MKNLLLLSALMISSQTLPSFSAKDACIVATGTFLTLAAVDSYLHNDKAEGTISSIARVASSPEALLTPVLGALAVHSIINGQSTSDVVLPALGCAGCVILGLFKKQANHHQ